MSIAVIRGESIHARFVMVRYNPRVLPIVSGVPKCSINISRQSDMSVFVASIDIKDTAIRLGLVELIRNASADMLIIKNRSISFLFPKYCSIFAL
jgi:hypothetical protein